MMEDEAVVPYEEILETMRIGEASAAIRYAVVSGSDQHLLLMLQCLPASADYLVGRPTFRG
jgi:hypothetical protein